MDKSFETLYAICMQMADKCLTDQSIAGRIEKLQEEHKEVIEAYELWKRSNVTINTESLGPQVFVDKEKAVDFINELADNLFVLLHLGRKMGQTPASLLHIAGSKMFGRLNDPHYIDKEQRAG